jgi:hypothetical protein
MPGLLLWGGTVRSAALRHEIPLAIVDPLLFAEVDGRRVVLTSWLERDRVTRALPDAEVLGAPRLGHRRRGRCPCSPTISRAPLLSSVFGRSRMRRRTGLEQARIRAASRQQSIVRPALDDLAVCEDEYLVGSADRGKSVGDDECRTADEETFGAPGGPPPPTRESSAGRPRAAGIASVGGTSPSGSPGLVGLARLLGPTQNSPSRSRGLLPRRRMVSSR